MDVDQMADLILESDYNQKWLRLGAHACRELALAIIKGLEGDEDL
jgi:hypothetical protein